ncbi:MAG: addiction module protein [Synechococcaceae cyanobacterium]|nr:addiction module protein [Synechococcaceae cyanobacterium]
MIANNVSRLMHSSLHQIEEQARSLSAADRAQLAESMLESLHTSIGEIEAAWSEEISERIEAFEKGEMPSYPAKQVFAEARNILQ